MNPYATVNLRQIAEYLRHLPEPSKPALRRWRATLMTDASVHMHLPRDREVDELIFLGATTMFGAPAWRYAGSAVWHPGEAPEANTNWIELGILPDLSAHTGHPRALDGEDYPDDTPMAPESPLLPSLHWATPTAVAVAGALFWIFR